MTLASLVPGQIAYNGYVFNTSWMVTDRTAAMILEPVDIPFAAGQSIVPGKMDVGVYTLQGVIGGIGSVVDHNNNPMITLDEVQAEVDYMMSFFLFGDAPLQIRTDRYVNAQLSQSKIAYATGNGYRMANITLDLKAQDPRSYGLTPYSYNLSTGSPASTVVSAYINNLGNAPAWPTFTLTFTATTVNPSITIYTSGGTYQITIRIVGTFTSGQVVTIVTDPRYRSVQLNGVTTYSIFNVAGGINTIPGDYNIMPYVQPLQTGIRLAMNASSGAYTLNATYSDTWL
jgi:hypothetical protein